jgi:hypothetical protein
MIPANVPAYTEMFTRWYRLKREGKLYPQDKEPDPKDFGLDSWAANHIKQRIMREMDR